MIDLLSSIWDLIVKIVATSPHGLWPLLLAFCGSALITQRAKFWIPIQWSPRARSALTQAIAFWSALGIVYALWPIPEGFVAGGCIGIASPTLYAITVRALGLKWPWLRDLLSQDVRNDS